MSSGLKIIIDGDEAKAFQAFQKLVDQQKDYQGAAKKSGKASSDASDEAIRAAKSEEKERQKQIRMAERLVKKHQTLEQSYKDEVKTLKAARDAGKLSNQQYEETLERVTEEHENVKRAQDESTDSVKDVNNLKTAWIGAGSAIALAHRALQFYNEEKDKGLETSLTLSDARQSLTQASDPEDLRANEQLAKDLAVDFGLDPVKAYQLVFDAISSGFVDEVRAVAAADPLVGVATGSKLTGEFREFFANENLSVENTFDSIAAGSAESVFNIPQLIEQVRKAATGRNVGGFSSSDVISTTAAIGTLLTERSGTAVENLSVKLGTDAEGRFKGLDLREAVEKLANDPELVSSFTGGNAQLRTYVEAAISTREAAAMLDADIESAQTDENKLFKVRLNNMFDESPQGRLNAELFQLRKLQAQDTLENEGFSSIQAARDKQSELRARINARGDGNFADRLAVDTANKTGVPGFGEAISTDSGQSTLRQVVPQIRILDEFTKIIDYMRNGDDAKHLREIADFTREISQNTAQPRSSPGLSGPPTTDQ